MTDQHKDDRGQGLLAELLPRLSQLNNALNRGRLFDQAVQAAGVPLDRPALSVLVTLRVAGRPLRVGEIAERMQVVGPHVTRQVNGLERQGLVRRITDPLDQRARLVEPTPEGAAASERYMRTVFGWFDDALADWPERDRKELGRLLGRLIDDLSAHLAAIDEDDRPTRR